MKRTQSILYSTLALSGVSLIVRALGFVYRVYLSRMLGAEGMGLYQLVQPLQMVAITLISSGIPLAVSRMCAARSEEQAQGVVLLASRVVRILSMGLTILLLLLAQPVTNLLGDSRVLPAYLVFLPSIIIVGLEAIYDGYFYGRRQVMPPAISELLEQVVRILAVFLLISRLENLTPALGAAIAMGAGVLGEIIGYIVVRVCFKQSPGVKQAGLVREMAAIAVPVTGTRLMSTLTNSLNSLLIPRQLQLFGLSATQALSQYGILTGMSMPLLFLPFTFTSSLATVMVPNLTLHQSRHQWDAIRSKLHKALMVTSTAAFPTMVLLYALGKPIGQMLYHETLAGDLIRQLSPLVPLLCFQHSLSSFLNGLGQQSVAARNMLLGTVLQLAATTFLVPQWGLMGYQMGMYISTVTVIILQGIRLWKMTGRMAIWETVGQPLVLALLEGFLLTLWPVTANTAGALVLAVVMLAIPWLGWVFLSGVLKKE